MTDTKMDALQNSVYVLKNTLSKYANKLAEDDGNKTSVVEVIYNVLLQMSKQENYEICTQVGDYFIPTIRL